MKYAAFVQAVTAIDDETPLSARGFIIIDSSEEASLTIVKEGTPQEHALTVTASHLKQRTKYIIFYSPLKGLVMVDHDTMFKSKDQWAYRSKTEVLGDPVANLYFHDTWEDSLFFSNIPPVSSETFTTVDYNTYIHDWIGTQYPEGEYSVGHNTNVRLEAFKDVETIDSVVALEQQVDLLQHIVVSLVRNEPLPSWATKFIDDTGLSCCTTLRDAESVVDDVINHKQAVRDAQKAYFDNRR